MNTTTDLTNLHSGWVAPDGTIHRVEFQGHIDAARVLIESGIVSLDRREEFLKKHSPNRLTNERYLELLGWLKISDERLFFIPGSSRDKLTEKQLNFIIDWMLTNDMHVIAFNYLNKNINYFLELKDFY